MQTHFMLDTKSLSEQIETQLKREIMSGGFVNITRKGANRLLFIRARSRVS